MIAHLSLKEFADLLTGKSLIERTQKMNENQSSDQSNHSGQEQSVQESDQEQSGQDQSDQSTHSVQDQSVQSTHSVQEQSDQSSDQSSQTPLKVSLRKLSSNRKKRKLCPKIVTVFQTIIENESIPNSVLFAHGLTRIKSIINLPELVTDTKIVSTVGCTDTYVAFVTAVKRIYRAVDMNTFNILNSVADTTKESFKVYGRLIAANAEIDANKIRVKNISDLMSDPSFKHKCRYGGFSNGFSIYNISVERESFILV